MRVDDSSQELRERRKEYQCLLTVIIVIEKVPGHVDAMLALSEMYKEQGMPSKALQLLELHTGHSMPGHFFSSCSFLMFIPLPSRVLKY